MGQRCEVCESFRPEGDLKPGRELITVSYDGRAVLLCRGHAGIAENSGVTSLSELAALFAESGGQRSYVGRRARTQTAGENATPRSPGRRASDVRL